MGKHLRIALAVALTFFAVAFSFIQPASGQFSPSADGILFPTKAWATLGDATSQIGKSFFSPDAPGGASLVLSDGSNWRSFARGVTSQSYTLTATDAGVHTFAYSYAVKPSVTYSLEDNTTTGLLTSNLYAVSATGATVRVNRGLLAALTGGTTTGVTINVTITPNN